MKKNSTALSFVTPLILACTTVNVVFAQRNDSKEIGAVVAIPRPSTISVNKTAYVDGQNVCGQIRISNNSNSSVTMTAVADSLEVHFPRSVPPPLPPPPAGSTPNWYKVADVVLPITLPLTVAPRATESIDYCTSLCDATDAPGANTMRNVVTVTATVSSRVSTITTRSISFPPPALDCRACCMPDGSCSDTLPDDCTANGGEPQGFGTSCTTATCLGACCWEIGCTNGVGEDTCVRLFPGTYLGNGSTCETQLAACPTGACCESFDSCIDFESEQYHVGRARCENSGGTYQGDGTVCADRSCAGACCWEIGCTNGVSERTCEELFDEGVYLGNDTRCETQLAACPTGACCHEGSCIDFASEQYHVGKTHCEIDFGGTFLGDGSACATASTSCKGACCWEVGCNNNVSPEDCADDFNGTYLGHDTTCQSELATCPTGACCLDGDCLGFETLGYGYSRAFCDSVGAFYVGDGAICTSTRCTEACCFGTTCEEHLPGECTALGGDPQGPGTNCPILGFTPCDVFGP